VFLALMLLAMSCKKDAGSVIPTKMSATIDGKSWDSLLRTTIWQTNSNTFVITGTSLTGEILVVTTYGSTAGTYELSVLPVKAQCAGSYKASATTSSGDIYVSSAGTVVLSKVDKTAKKISGTFSFTLVKNLSDTKTVTNGVFTDLSYTETGQD
jgi:hypothetical protein